MAILQRFIFVKLIASHVKGSSYTCICPEDHFLDEKNNECKPKKCDDGFGWGRPYGGTEYGCFDIDECSEEVDKCEEPKPMCLNRKATVLEPISEFRNDYVMVRNYYAILQPYFYIRYQS